MLWYFIQLALAPIFPIFFKRLQGKNLKRVRVKAPVFIAMNHPNSFMDSMGFTGLLFLPKTFYMARGDAFKNKIIAAIIQSIGLVPIFRFKDVGYESAKQNVESFKTVYKLLDEKSKIMVFAEGLSMQERRLIPLKKGTAKMALSYLEQGGRPDIQILPVGVTYSTPSKFRGDAYYQVGEPIYVKDYYEAYKQNGPQTILKLTKVIEDGLKPLTLSLANKENDVLIEQLQPILKRQFIEEHHLNYNKLEHQQQYWEFIVSKLNEITAEKPQEIIGFRKQVDDYTRQLHQLNLRDHLISLSVKNKTLVTVVNVFLLIVGFPFYVVGKTLNIIPYYFAKRVADKKCKEIEFYSAVNFGVGSILIIFLSPVELLLVGLVFGNWKAVLIYALLKSVCGLIGLHYSIFKKKMLGAFSLRKIKNTAPTLLKSLQHQRAQIVNFINK
jgi:glycerol-3-phosphate O-acyltransferase/dihydroxyacetone phosphate acyltransferase